MSTRNYVDGAWYNQYNDAHWFACITTDGSRVILIPYKLRMRNDGSINTNCPDGSSNDFAVFRSSCPRTA